MMTKTLPANSRVPWSSLELLSDFTDGAASLQPLCKATQNAKGVCFVELAEMESTLKLTSDHAFAVLVPAKKEKHVVPQAFRGKSYDLTIIARQAGVEVLKTCTCFQLGSREASLTIRTAEVSLPDAKTVEGFPMGRPSHVGTWLTANISAPSLDLARVPSSTRMMFSSGRLLCVWLLVNTSNSALPGYNRLGQSTLRMLAILDVLGVSI